MHKGMILLTRADSKNDARNRVESFLERYGDGNVWDWYVIGGRWSGTLNKNTKKFFKLVEEAKLFKDPNFVSTKDVEDNQTKLQEIWEKMGEKSPNPYNRDSYKDDGDDTDDVMLATECRQVIKDWTKDMTKKAEEFWKKAKAEKRKEAKVGKRAFMSSYYAKLYGECADDEFTFESNVYDIDNFTNMPPTKLTGVYAVMCDLHN